MQTVVHYVCDICGRNATDEAIIRICEELGVPKYQPVGTQVRLQHTIGLTHPLARQYKSEHFCFYNGCRELDGEYYLEGTIIEVKIISNADPLPITMHWTQTVPLPPNSLAHYILYCFQFEAPNRERPSARESKSVWLLGPSKVAIYSPVTSLS